MQMTGTTPSAEPKTGRSTLRNLGWFLIIPFSALVIMSLTASLVYTGYQEKHADKIYTGVQIWGVELGEMTVAEAETAVAAAFPYPQSDTIRFVNPADGTEWALSPAELGVSFDAAATVAAAYEIGREGGPSERMRTQFDAWYYGHPVAPVVIFDEGQLDTALAGLANSIDKPAIDAELLYDGETVSYQPAETGLALDRADARARLLSPIGNLNAVEIELRVEEVLPAITDTSAAAAAVENVVGTPMTLYLAEPLDDADLLPIEITRDQLVRWLRIETESAADGSLSYQVSLDQNGLQDWLRQFEDQLYREPVRARFYFDDPTQELVLVEPHVNGRALNVAETAARISAQALSNSRSVAFAVDDIVPDVHSGAKGADLGITELLTESTTWFYGSSPERRHNIARAAVNFYGIVVAPGEEFSFNEWLGPISLDDGYETGLVIFGGDLQEGVGGGVCQVSTTLYQTAFWAGFPIKERQEHGYQIHYYDDGEGPGMDATIYSPIVDFRFVNNTPHHLLIENYYNETFESLTFKFYSTSLGRTVEKDGPTFENVKEPPADRWEFNEDLEDGEIKQLDWAVEGARVTVHRIVRNANGELLDDQYFVSNYIPWPNIYQYGRDADLPPGVTPQYE
ncbi:MAG: VanW family protein [Ardenticatenales bacterium]|nr:VanW family protein [Ardenticatenales bacterium]